MRKVAILLMFLLIGNIVFAQGKNVLDNTGYDWVSWTTMEKTKFVLGWMSSLSALIELINYWQDEYEMTEGTNNALNAIMDWSFYDGTVGDIILVLDRTFTDVGAREYRIWDVLLTLYDKEWW